MIGTLCYELSAAADRDLNDIYIYSYREFGEAKADAHFRSLEECFERLAEFPDIGRPIDHIRPGYFRFPHASHSVYFVKFAREFESFEFYTSAWTRNAISEVQ
jgi:toxin ParE1/3/4